MNYLWITTLGLVLLLIGCTTADPDIGSPLRAVRSSACQEHTNLHTRLDVIEKRVEDTVERLEGELVALLDKIEDPKWSPLVDSTGQHTVDILEDPENKIQQ